MSTPTLAQVVAVLDELYPPAWAEDWDRPGLVCGDPDAPVEHVLLAVDPVDVVVDEAIETGAQLVLAHHPLLMRGTSTVAANFPKGRVVHRLIREGVALFTAHTNADSARPGVSDALARVVGLVDLEPLVPASHDATLGLGRVGRLEPPLPLRAFAEQVAQGLPATAGGVRVSGDPDAIVERVAVCGGAGDSLFADVRAAGVDAYVTADLRHHPASEAREQAPGIALVEVSHWASEWPWLHGAAERLTAHLASLGLSATTTVSTRSSDPWSFHVPSPSETTR
ncbi:Nif3-like dinuclear metal center hexameric protein [Quadrisphaera granulorum]|uniref:Nif3-like dinuclear metal center hexameric protein n=1 Tax=Quadrisphaera granulorum TaxID=317664 RepID=UPI001B8616EC|nr:Nif3-like dinuclear metal center hexameric protein [Quadrisphaera granulorum]